MRGCLPLDKSCGHVLDVASHLCVGAQPPGHCTRSVARRQEPAAVRIDDAFVDEIQMVRFLRREPRVAG